ncbi:MAG: Hsp20/alpha crystallin family protein [candidate division KSB1 bacterium]|nr:Hsp20/alpha crystallin family protein [candidate division KSB1 bacterium]MDZ7275429.1 Hsp20/alpha crystallin family protein [candidate division KSB1 bacterium]MDZ7286259.1 Hsp20/alpha crystallin family protein [candidate division KSB1 bacterium]MDZ7296485.1 Hsp20/alpha crystallin family protein [candidate division KSB1 bacterium]MDZ7305557.1 Hsp20/alpha crystallin family protein [candidate division KSB1 bacterium]
MLVKWHPAATVFSELENTLLRDWFNGTDTLTSFVPEVDILEGKDGFILRAELPGVRKDDLKITLDNGMLTLGGEKRLETGDAEQSFHLRETRQGRFERRFRLGEGIDRSNIKADYKDGVLTVTLPKSKEAMSREIDIRVS